MEIYSIGFTQKTAQEFFNKLRNVGVRKVIDVRLNNRSQLAGFTRQEDLAFFVEEILDASYLHEPLLAPTKDLLLAYRQRIIEWPAYECQFLALLESRRITDSLSRDFFAGPSVLLCSEATPDRCHRRLVIEFLNERWGSVTAVHL